jgi:hypothetical protein
MFLLSIVPFIICLGNCFFNLFLSGKVVYFMFKFFKIIKTFLLKNEIKYKNTFHIQKIECVHD